MTRARFLAGPFLLVSYIVFWFSHTVVDPDLWGHIRFGQDILDTRSIVQTDHYSYRTAGQLWINHEWLSEVVFAALYNAAGPPGLIAFKVVASVLILGLCYRHLRRYGLGPYRSLALLALVTVPFRMGLGTIRPQIFTYFLFLLLLLLLERASTGRLHCIWLVPILFASWINLHGGVLAGAGVLGLWIAARVARSLFVETRGASSASRIALLGASLAIASGLAMLMNPYGAELVSFLLRTATVPRPEINEWAPLALLSFPGQLFLVLLAIGIAGFAGSRRERKPEAILIFGATALATIMANRHYPLFALALLVVAGEHIADAWNRWWPADSSGLGLNQNLAVTSFVASLLFLFLSIPRFGCIRIDSFYFAFPAHAVAFLKQSGVRGNMAVPFDWGEYVIWHLGPAVQVSIDGRRETVYSEASYRQAQDFAHGTGVWDALLKTSPTDLVLAANGSPTANLMSLESGWRALYQDRFCVVFVRSGLPDLDRFMQTPLTDLPDNGEGLCFPSLKYRRPANGARAQ
jgi:hypothetical protein